MLRLRSRRSKYLSSRDGSPIKKSGTGKLPNEKKHAEHKLHRAVLAFFCITLAMAVFHLFGIGHGHIEEGAEILSFSKWSTFLAITLPA